LREQKALKEKQESDIRISEILKKMREKKDI
jgi:hypothetical protein